METPLSIAEKIYLFSVHPEKGGIVGVAYNSLAPVLTGAIFFDLIAAKNIVLDEKRIVLVDKKSADPLHSFVLGKIAETEKQRTVLHWIHRLSWSQNTRRTFIKESLKLKRLIRIEKKQFLFLRWDKVFLTDRGKVTGMIVEVEHQINGITKNGIDDGLLSLLIPSELLRRMFPDSEKRKNIKTKLKQMQLENVVSKAVTDAIRTARAAAAS